MWSDAWVKDAHLTLVLAWDMHKLKLGVGIGWELGHSEEVAGGPGGHQCGLGVGVDVGLA